MKLIREEVQDIQYLVEADGKGGQNHFITGIFMQADKLNRNGRIYPFNVLDKEASRDRKSTRLNSVTDVSRMPSSA